MHPSEGMHDRTASGDACIHRARIKLSSLITDTIIPYLRRQLNTALLGATKRKVYPVVRRPGQVVPMGRRDIAPLPFPYDIANSDRRQKATLTLRLTASHAQPATLRAKQISSFLSKGRGDSPLPQERGQSQNPVDTFVRERNPRSPG